MQLNSNQKQLLVFVWIFISVAIWNQSQSLHFKVLVFLL